MFDLQHPEPGAAIALTNLTHQYGSRPALHDLSLRVEQGSFVSVLGPNGSGKTTLFRILSTLLRPSNGKAQILGHDTTAESHRVRRLLGVVFQSPALDVDLSVRENLTHHGALYGLHGRPLRSRIDELLSQFGMADRATDRVRTLSGGQVRRVDLVRGLLHAPRVLLLDEPTTGLDPAARRSFWQSLAEIRRRHETTVVVATHLTDEADESDQTIILHEGRLVTEGSPDRLRAEIGSEALWIETPRPESLISAIEDRFSAEVDVIGASVLVRSAAAHDLVGPIYEAFGPMIDSLAVRRPTLEDVLLYHTGARLPREEAEAHP